MGKLTTKKMRDLKSPGRYADGDGLYLHVREGGSRQWVLRTTVHGRRKDIGLGSLSIVKLDEARIAASAMRRSAKQGHDPLQERRKRRATPSYEEAARHVWVENRSTWKNAKHADQWINTQATYAFPKIGDLRIDRVTSGHLLDVLQPIWLEKEETARRLKQRMKMVFDWAKVAGHRTGDSPLDGILKALPRQSRKVKHHDALRWEELPKFVLKLRQREADAVSAKALQFVILTALRSAEVRLATWSEIDLAKRIWVVPAERMKMKREHRVPLAPEAIKLLEGCRDYGSKFVFPSDKSERPLSNMAFAALIDRMGMKGFTPHGFRSTFRDWSSENEAAPREIAEMVLAHKVGDKTEQAYARSDLLERRRSVMEKWAAYVFSADR
ncbi:integrase arm-type DNA-binding domain-containing protein [Mesorhizobium sp. KR9-304]|uniref:tyrosine-type recombinase/integrase n=1 Tax=Mesorhizobium sp. KR9-304 TaxID=3156614 RepID=UPI0032B4B7C1